MSRDSFPFGMRRSFDGNCERLLGGMFGRVPPVQRMDIWRLLSEQARELLRTASQAAAEWGSADVDRAPPGLAGAHRALVGDLAAAVWGLASRDLDRRAVVRLSSGPGPVRPSLVHGAAAAD